MSKNLRLAQHNADNWDTISGKVRYLYQGLLPWVKGSERESDESDQYSAEVKNAWSFTYTPTYVFVARC